MAPINAFYFVKILQINEPCDDNFIKKKKWKQNEFSINVQPKQRIHNEWRFDWNMFYQVSGFEMRKNNHNKIHFQHFKWVFFAFTFQFKLINLVFNSNANDSGSLKKKQMWEKIMFGRQNNKQPNWRNGNFSSKMNKFAMNARANFSIDCFNDVYSDLELAALDAIDSIVIACYSFASKFATKKSVFLFYKKKSSLT